MRRFPVERRRQLEVSISGGSLSAPVSFSITAGGFTTAQDLATVASDQIGARWHKGELFVEVDTDATSESGVSLVLRSAGHDHDGSRF